MKGALPETSPLSVDHASQALRLVVVGRTSMSSHTLPRTGTLVIGRDVDADIRVDESAVSRRHVEVDLSQMRVRDLESANGSQLSGAKLPPMEWRALRPGDVLAFGSAVAFLQRFDPTAASRLLVGHGYFELRVDEACRHAAAGGPVFSVLRVAGADTRELASRLAGLLNADDVLGQFSPNELEVLAFGPSSRAELFAQQLSAGHLTARCFGPDGRSAAELLALPSPQEVGRANVVIVSPIMRELHALARRAGDSDLSVLILGETGVGKEVLAETIHEASPRAKKPLVRLNCAAFTESLLEAELFGYEKGAFTGAVKAKAGLLESADGGTVFLDEIGEVPLTTQVKLLRVLEQREVQRVGALKPRRIDVRFVAATNRDLAGEVRRGAFRQDLYFRLDGVCLVVPPLRERREEIRPLAEAFLGAACARNKRRVPRVADDVWPALEAAPWPGNVRELKNAIERALVLSSGPVLEREHFALERLASAVVTPAGDQSEKRSRVEAALAAAAGNQTEAARTLGVSRKTLMAWMDELGLARPRKSHRA